MTVSVDFTALGRWCTFFQRPSVYMHPSRVCDYIDTQLLSALSAKKVPASRLHYYLSQMILSKQHDLTPPFHKVPSAQWNLLISPIRHIHTIAFIIGALEIGPWVRRAIDGATVQLIVKTLGTQLLQFVRTRHGGFHSGSPERHVTDTETLPRVIEMCGYATLSKTMPVWPEVLRPVWRMRMPKDVDSTMAVSLSPDALLTLCFQVGAEIPVIFKKS